MFHQWCQISLNMGCLQFWAVTLKGMKFCRIWENFRLNIHSYIYLSVHFPSSFLLTYKAKSDLLRPKSSPNLASETQIQPPDSGSETQIWPQDPNQATRPKSGSWTDGNSPLCSTGLCLFWGAAHLPFNYTHIFEQILTEAGQG